MPLIFELNFALSSPRKIHRQLLLSLLVSPIKYRFVFFADKLFDCWNSPTSSNVCNISCQYLQSFSYNYFTHCQLVRDTAIRFTHCITYLECFSSNFIFLHQSKYIFLYIMNYQLLVTNYSNHGARQWTLKPLSMSDITARLFLNSVLTRCTLNGC